MIKLRKLSSTTWCGNGFGTSTAEWVVVGHEHIALKQLGINWVALNRDDPSVRYCRAATKKDLVELLSLKF